MTVTFTMSKYNIKYIRIAIHILNDLKFWVEIWYFPLYSSGGCGWQNVANQISGLNFWS